MDMGNILQIQAMQMLMKKDVDPLAKWMLVINMKQNESPGDEEGGMNPSALIPMMQYMSGFPVMSMTEQDEKTLNTIQLLSGLTGNSAFETVKDLPRSHGTSVNMKLVFSSNVLNPLWAITINDEKMDIQPIPHKGTKQGLYFAVDSKGESLPREVKQFRVPTKGSPTLIHDLGMVVFSNKAEMEECINTYGQNMTIGQVASVMLSGVDTLNPGLYGCVKIISQDNKRPFYTGIGKEVVRLPRMDIDKLDIFDTFSIRPELLNSNDFIIVTTTVNFGSMEKSFDTYQVFKVSHKDYDDNDKMRYNSFLTRTGTLIFPRFNGAKNFISHYDGNAQAYVYANTKTILKNEFDERLRKAKNLHKAEMVGLKELITGLITTSVIGYFVEVTIVNIKKKLTKPPVPEPPKQKNIILGRKYDSFLMKGEYKRSFGGTIFTTVISSVIATFVVQWIMKHKDEIIPKLKRAANKVKEVVQTGWKKVKNFFSNLFGSRNAVPA